MTQTDDKLDRQVALQQWAKRVLVGLDVAVGTNFQIETASDDASFRRYFRSEVPGYIFVDAPPDKENNPAFVLVRDLLASAGVSVPDLVTVDYDLGFLVLSDLGNQLLLPILKAGDPEPWYRRAVAEIGKVQQAQSTGLDSYSEAKLVEEMCLFPEWFVQKQLGLGWDFEASQMFQHVIDLMLNNATAQPQVFVHRDFHARNLMISDDGAFSVIDFQDAVQGPVTYDLVSLLKDCYFRLPRHSVELLVENFRCEHGLEVSQSEFRRWFDLMGFQRHLKCAGIFSRLNQRDGKPGYLQDIPLVISYLQEVCDLYSELGEFGDWLDQYVLPEVGKL